MQELHLVVQLCFLWMFDQRVTKHYFPSTPLLLLAEDAARLAQIRYQ